MANDGQKPWYIRKGWLLFTLGLFIMLTLYVLLTPIVLLGGTFYGRFRRQRWLATLAAKGPAAFWLTLPEKKEFVSLNKIIINERPKSAGGDISPEDQKLVEAKARYASLCSAPLRRRTRFIREYGLAYGAPAGLITWLIALVLYSFQFDKGIFESFFFYFHFPIRILTRTMLEGELGFILSMSTTALAVALITWAVAAFMAGRLAERPELVTPENYQHYGDSV